jgi:transposase-like protein
MVKTSVLSHAQNGRVPESDPSARPKKRSFTPEYKLSILEQLDALTEPSARAALVRREGLYSSHVAEWRKARDAGALEGLAAKPRARRSPERLEVERLRRQNERLSRQLERTKLALEITGKAHALLEALSESAASEDPRSPR